MALSAVPAFQWVQAWSNHRHRLVDCIHPWPAIGVDERDACLDTHVEASVHREMGPSVGLVAGRVAQDMEAGLAYSVITPQAMRDPAAPAGSDA